MTCGCTRGERKGTQVYLWLIHADVWQKPTQHCKVELNYPSIKNKNRRGKAEPHTSSLFHKLLHVGGLLPMGVLLPLRGKPSQRQGEEPGPKLLLRQPSHLILHSGQGICALSAKPEGKRCKGEMWRPGEEVSPAGGGCWLLLKAPSQGPHLLGAKLALGLSAGPAGNHPLLSPSSLPGWKSDQNLKQVK